MRRYRDDGTIPNGRPDSRLLRSPSVTLSDLLDYDPDSLELLSVQLLGVAPALSQLLSHRGPLLLHCLQLLHQHLLTLLQLVQLCQEALLLLHLQLRQQLQTLPEGEGTRTLV